MFNTLKSWFRETTDSYDEFEQRYQSLRTKANEQEAFRLRQMAKVMEENRFLKSELNKSLHRNAELQKRIDICLYEVIK